MQSTYWSGVEHYIMAFKKEEAQFYLFEGQLEDWWSDVKIAERTNEVVHHTPLEVLDPSQVP